MSRSMRRTKNPGAKADLLQRFVRRTSALRREVEGTCRGARLRLTPPRPPSRAKEPLANWPRDSLSKPTYRWGQVKIDRGTSRGARIGPICAVWPIAPSTYYEHHACRSDPDKRPKPRAR